MKELTYENKESRINLTYLPQPVSATPRAPPDGHWGLSGAHQQWVNPEQWTPILNMNNNINVTYLSKEHKFLNLE